MAFLNGLEEIFRGSRFSAYSEFSAPRVHNFRDSKFSAYSAFSAPISAPIETYMDISEAQEWASMNPNMLESMYSLV